MTSTDIAGEPDDPRADLIRLARRAGRGDEAALGALVAQTSPTVWRACAALVDRDSADDLTQDTYLRAMRSLSSYRGDASPTRWLLTIARRVCAEEIERRQRGRAVVSRLEFRARADHAGRADPSRLVDLTEMLGLLSVERREAFVLTVVAGLSYEEAAQMCQCPVGTIRSRVSRARAELVAALDADRETVAAV